MYSTHSTNIKPGLRETQTDTDAIRQTCTHETADRGAVREKREKEGEAVFSPAVMEKA